MVSALDSGVSNSCTTWSGAAHDRAGDSRPDGGVPDCSPREPTGDGIQLGVDVVGTTDLERAKRDPIDLPCRQSVCDSDAHSPPASA